MDHIAALEKILGKKVEMEMLPQLPGEVPDSHANVNDLIE